MSLSSLRDIRRELYESPIFGQSDRILQATGDVSATLLRRILDATGRLPSEIVRAVARDPGVRYVARLAFTSVVTPDCEVLRAIVGIRESIENRNATGLAACVESYRCGDDGGVGLNFVHRFTRRNSVGAIFEKRLHDEYLRGLPPLRWATPNAEETRAGESGLELLSRAFREVAKSSLDHVDLAFMMTTEQPGMEAEIFGSLSASWLPGVIFLSPYALRSPLSAAEFIFHEATHCKLFNLYLTQNILRKGYTPEGSVKVAPPWRSNLWSMDRTLAAAHVYVHLTALYTALGELGDEDLVSRCDLPAQARTYWQRADWLARELDARGRDELGEDGKSLSDWLSELVARLEACLPSQ
jgi:hypothetical protein